MPNPARLSPTILRGSITDPKVNSLLAGIVSDDPEVRTQAWVGAGEVGPAAIPPLVEMMSHPNVESARAAKRGVWKIVRHVSRPGAEDDRSAVVAGLVEVVEGPSPVPIKIEALRMLPEIAGDSAVPALAASLSDVQLREDARTALERIPGEASLAVLVQAFVDVPEAFKPAIVRSLRNRGVEVEGYPEEKLIPSRPTKVQPIP